MASRQRIELLIFTACFLAFAYFHQGGGWNQNARFAEVRAIVEEGRLAIDNFLVYEVVPGSPVLRRAPVDHGEFIRNGGRYRLAWVDMNWKLFPVNGRPTEPGVYLAPIVEAAASGDISYVAASGHFHPNKPPGTSFFGVPAYWLLYQVERLVGVDPDHWWVLTLNAWLTTLCSVGLASAFGCVLFLRLGRELAPENPVAPLGATLAFAFGTTFFPFATLFFDHALTASLLVAAFYFLRCRQSAPAAVAAGVCAGMAAVTNYLAAVPGMFLGVYSVMAAGAWGGKMRWRRAGAYIGGVLGPFLLICAYDWACFGSPFAINNDFQNPLFKSPGNAVLGMFLLPDSVEGFWRMNYLLGLLTVSPFRGVFYFCPVLVLGFFGLWKWVRDPQARADALLCAAVAGFFFVVNLTFNGYPGGHSAGPRYLVPGIPFLALPLVAAFARFPWVTGLVALVSITNQLVLTATDAQNPAGVGGFARVEGVREEWDYNPIGDYAWPLFVYGRAWPLLNQQIALQMDRELLRIESVEPDPQARAKAAQDVRAGLLQSINQGAASPFLLGSVRGPVSVNPVGVFEGPLTYGFFPPGSPQCRFASFNVGEFMFPGSRWSLLPLLVLVGGMSGLATGMARRAAAFAPTGEPVAQAQTSNGA